MAEPKDNKLLICPFCGNNPVGPEHGDSEWWIECEHCEIVMSRQSKLILIESWNTRYENDIRA